MGGKKWRQHFHEFGHNFSRSSFKTSDFIKHKFPIEASGLYVFVTGAGCYIRSLIDDIEVASCIIYINKEASGYFIIWGGNTEGFTSLTSVVKLFKLLKTKKNNPKNPIIVPSSNIELIVLSHHPIFNDEEKLNHSIWKMCPEVSVYVPRGINCTPYSITQSDDLANSTTHAFTYRDVALWEKHGATTTAENFEKAWDFLDVANKGAKLLLASWAAGFEPKGLSKEQLQELKEHFKN